MSRLGHPNLGVGVGLRNVHFDHVLRTEPRVDWFEVISENFMHSRGWPRHVLEWIADRYPVVMHGVSMSIGSTDQLDFEYLAELKRLAERVRPVWISDHLCWTGVLGRDTHDLLPLPMNEGALRHVVARVRIVQDFLEQHIVLENPSTYLRFAADTMHEWDFLGAVAEEADCGLLLDVNNIYVSSVNHGFDPHEYIESVPSERVVQFHVAGHRHCGTHIIDTHDGAVADEVWRLYRTAVRLIGEASTLLEWDSNIPEFPAVHSEALKARRALDDEGWPSWIDQTTSERPADATETVSGAHPPHLALVDAV